MKNEKKNGNQNDNKIQVTHHIVYSTKGGCGKTAFSLYLALCGSLERVKIGDSVYYVPKAENKYDCNEYRYLLDLDLLGSSLEYNTHINKSETVDLSKFRSPCLQELLNNDKHISEIRSWKRHNSKEFFHGEEIKDENDGTISDNIFIVPVGASEKEKAMFHVKKGTTPLLRYEELEAQLNGIQQSIVLLQERKLMIFREKTETLIEDLRGYIEKYKELKEYTRKAKQDIIDTTFESKFNRSKILKCKKKVLDGFAEISNKASCIKSALNKYYDEIKGINDEARDSNSELSEYMDSIDKLLIKSEDNIKKTRNNIERFNVKQYIEQIQTASKPRAKKQPVDIAEEYVKFTDENFHNCFEELNCSYKYIVEKCKTVQLHIVYDLAPNADSYTDAVLNEIFSRVMQNSKNEGSKSKEEIILYLVSNSSEMLRCNVDWVNTMMCGEGKRRCPIILVNNDNVGEFSDLSEAETAVNKNIKHCGLNINVEDSIVAHMFFEKDSISMRKFKSEELGKNPESFEYKYVELVEALKENFGTKSSDFDDEFPNISRVTYNSKISKEGKEK